MRASVPSYLSFAIGYRYAHGHEIYLTPKVYLIEDVRLAQAPSSNDLRG